MTSGEIKVELYNDVGEVERGNQKCQWKRKEIRKKKKSGERKRAWLSKNANRYIGTYWYQYTYIVYW
jgi:hypothetical protein